MGLASVSYTRDASEDKINRQIRIYKSSCFYYSFKVNSEKMAQSGSYQDPKMTFSSSDFLNLVIIDISDHVILSLGGWGGPVHCRMLSVISCLHPLPASSTFPVVTTQNVHRLEHVFREASLSKPLQLNPTGSIVFLWAPWVLNLHF